MQNDFSIEATGTKWVVSLWSDGNDTEQDCRDAWQSCVVLMEEFESQYSRFKVDSFLRAVSGVTGTFDVPKNFSKMLAMYREIAEATDGAFTPLGAQVLSDMGYDENYSFSGKENISEVLDFLDTVEILSDGKIEITKPVYFDLGALGKGYLADQLLEHMREYGFITKVLINAGGDILHWDASGTKIRVGLENPDNPEQVIGVYELGNGALASSAPNRRKWQDQKTGCDRHHIFDPFSSTNPTELKAAWVAHDSLAWADGLATAFFVADAEKLAAAFDSEYLTIAADNTFLYSEEFKNSLNI